MTSETLVVAEGLAQRFGEVPALEQIDLELPAGGPRAARPNGAGKTTTVGILATLLKPDAGSARAGGFDVVSRDPGATAGARSRS